MLPLLLSILVAAFLGAIALSRTRRRKAARRAEAVQRCRCGYEIKGWDQARCPECGRVIGFDASAEELGLTEEELARAAERRRQRGQL